MTDRETGRPARWLKPALAVSLILNLLVAGIVVGAVAGHHRGDERMSTRDGSFGPYTEALSRSDRSALRRAFLAASPDRAAMRREEAEDYGRLIAALRADPFDPADVEAVIGTQEARLTARVALGRQLLTERIAAMSPAQREAFAERIEAAMTRRRDD
ncbi:MAG: periplasmic heavy metal sensor [Paracoccaceae bacterium]